ncbi:MAG TPA: penicillin-binding protein 2 [Candidatus Sulfotelmatobacter sp.]|nr:penicillin-binding protein 2 [Candidatus Sulfotelmatobacter sp.]
MFGRDEKVSEIRLTVAQYIILGIFLVLAYGLWKLQVMESGYYASAAEKNRVRNVPILAPRGKILDRYGRIVVDNYPSTTALLLRDSSRDLAADADLIAQGLHLDPNEVRARIRRFASMPQYQPIFLKEDITPDELQFIEAHRNELPELDTIDAARRLYPRNGFMAHLIGYVGEVSEDMLNQPQFELYNAGDVVGISGVERQYNTMLMGTNGSRQALVDSHGREVGRLGETEAVPGKPLKLTLDVDLQIAAEEALGDKNGAVVAMDPHTGEILAMVSRPTFDPNEFAVHVSRDEWNKLVNDPDKPLLNKAIQAQLAPGSTFKVIMSFAGWQEGIAQNMHVHCNGSADFYGRNSKCWVYFLHQSHGDVDLAKAIYQSCDIFFYTLADKLGINRIAKYATQLGLGQKTGIDLPQEASGLVPSEEWKARTFHQKWYAGETIFVGIGQGAITVTPVQLLRAISAVSMGGKLVVPHVINPTDLPSNYQEAAHFTEVTTVPLDPGGWNVITDAMGRVLLPEGTAFSAHIPGIDIAGKTGSAQVVSLENRAKHKDNADLAQNGWFVGFTPRRNPDVVVCVLFQGGEHGKLAARVATQVIKAYVEKQRRTPQKMVEKPKSNGTVDIGGLWTEPDSDGDKGRLAGGRFVLHLPRKPLALATAAPGMQ